MRKSSLFDKLNQNSSADAKNKLREIRAMYEDNQIELSYIIVLFNYVISLNYLS
jgi:hypothetical protein